MADPVVAFTVAHGEVKVYNTEERIEFETVITNEGGGFLPGQNEFLCPINGMYLFSHSSAAWANSFSITEIWMDDIRLVTSFAVNDVTPAASNSVLVHCTSGGKVYIQCDTLHACTPWGTDGNFHNTVTFSGYLVAGDE